MINFTPLFKLNLVPQIKRYELLEQIIKISESEFSIYYSEGKSKINGKIIFAN